MYPGVPEVLGVSVKGWLAQPFGQPEVAEHRFAAASNKMFPGLRSRWGFPAHVRIARRAQLWAISATARRGSRAMLGPLQAKLPRWPNSC